MNSTLSSDRPQTDPAQDLFGYAPFAETLTKALCNYGSSDPLVLGLYGAWGSGKSTLLKFICHNLNTMPEKERPIVIEFNPWWFSGRENLARVFLEQLQAVVLSKKYNALNKLGKLLGDFSESIGGAIDAVASTGGWGKKVGSLAKCFFKRPPKDVPALKEEICAILQLLEKRIVIMIDDIDRLDAEEMRQLFTVIKALADFPNVIYLLAFDQAVVVQALEKYSDIPGREYLEKIIQASFVVPHADRIVLVDGLNKRLDEILDGTLEGLCSQSRKSLFFGALEIFFTVPRDVVRFCNTVAVTYSAVRNEVNAVDFIVIEAIRFFLPDLYMYIRENKDKFIFEKMMTAQELEKVLTMLVPESIHKHVENLLNLLFPYLTKNVINESYARRNLLIYSKEIAPCYFRFTSSPNAVTYTEMLQWLGKAGDADAFGSVLLQAKAQGVLRVEKFLDRLRDYTDEYIQKKDIKVVISVLLNVGDELARYFYNGCESLFFNIYAFVVANAESLSRRLPLEQRLPVLEQAIRAGSALVVQCRLLSFSETAIKNRNEPLIPEEELLRFKYLFLEKLDERILNNTLLTYSNVEEIISRCWEWDSEKIKRWCAELIKKDEDIFFFLERIIIPNFSSLIESAAETYIDIADFERRILVLQEENKIPPEYKEAVDTFLQGVASWREKKQRLSL